MAKQVCSIISCHIVMPRYDVNGLCCMSLSNSADSDRDVVSEPVHILC
jgi:hypothetical protein